MALTVDDYTQQLQALLPWGPAWPRSPEATVTKLLQGFADELARVDARADALASEANPLSTAELLGDWERVAGLPDNCSGELSESTSGRTGDLVAKLASTGGQSRAYYIGVAAAMGYEVTITEFRPFRIGSRVGSPLCGRDWAFAWEMRAPETTVRLFRVGARVGERLASWGNASLECRMKQIKPAHTQLLFRYGPLRVGALLLEDGSGALLLEDGSGTITVE